MEKENFDSLRWKFLTVWKRKFWQFEKENLTAHNSPTSPIANHRKMKINLHANGIINLSTPIKALNPFSSIFGREKNSPQIFRFIPFITFFCVPWFTLSLTGFYGGISSGFAGRPPDWSIDHPSIKFAKSSKPPNNNFHGELGKPQKNGWWKKRLYLFVCFRTHRKNIATYWQYFSFISFSFCCLFLPLWDYGGELDWNGSSNPHWSTNFIHPASLHNPSPQNNRKIYEIFFKYKLFSQTKSETWPEKPTNGLWVACKLSVKFLRWSFLMDFEKFEHFVEFDEFWSILKHFKAFCWILKHFEAFWSILKHFVEIWSIFLKFEAFC